MYRFNRFVCAVFCLSLVFSTSSFAEKLTLGCIDWHPFSGNDLENKGLFNESVQKAGAAVGLDIDIKIMPWKRVMLLTKQGKLDGISCPSYQKERESWLAYTKNHFSVIQGGLFAHKDSQIQGIKLNNLKGKIVGVPAGSSVVKFVTDYSKGQFTIKEFFDEDSALKMLHGKRFDAIYLSLTTGKKLLRGKFSKIADDIEYLGTLNKVFIHPAISLTHPRAKEIAKKLDAGYQIIKENGELEKITYRAFN